jgi:hypothetical protein
MEFPLTNLHERRWKSSPKDVGEVVEIGERLVSQVYLC